MARAIVLSLLLAALSWGMAGVSGAGAQSDEGAPDDSEARVHFRLGLAYYESGRFDDAAREFEQAYELSRRPVLLHNIFVAHRDAGNLGPAVRALREYLRLVPDAPEREQLTARLATMERLYEQQGGDDGERGEAPQAEPSEPDPDEASSEDPAAAGPSEPARTTDGGTQTWTPGWIIAGVGGAAAIAGVITGALALQAQSQLGEMCDESLACDPGFEDTRDTGALLAGLTDGLLFGGLAVAATGVVLALVLSTRSPERVTAGLGCGPDGCGGAVQVRY